MRAKLFNKPTNKKVQAVRVSIKMLTIIGGEPDDEPGKAEDEELNLVYPDASLSARVLTLLWARVNGLPVEKDALESFIKALQNERAFFDKGESIGKIVRGGRSTLNKVTCVRLNYYAACRHKGLDDEAARKETAHRQGVGIGKWTSEREGVNRAIEKHFDGGQDRDWSQVKY